MEEIAELQLSPLQLHRYFIKELHYAVKAEFDGKYDQTAAFPYPQLTAQVTHVQNEETQRDWSFELAVKSEDSGSTEFPYTLKIVLVGYFSVREGYPPDRADMLAKVNGPSVLYSAAREALVTITGRSGFPAIVLPSVIFIQNALTPAKAPQKESSAEKSASPQQRAAKSTKGASSSKKTSKKHNE